MANETSADNLRSDQTISIVLGAVRYLLDNPVPGSLLREDTSTETSPRCLTVFNVQKGDSITDISLAAFRAEHLDVDDVFQPSFLSSIVFLGGTEDGLDVQPSAFSLLATWQNTHLSFVKPRYGEHVYAPGPYISYLGKCWEPWRSYEDKSRSMTVSCKPNCIDGVRLLSELDGCTTPGPIKVVVPSRVYSSTRKNADKPLLGVRIAVKDIFDIGGFKTSLCNRAWSEYHGVKTATAPCVKRLQDLGAIIVGKTRLNAMLVREETMECVEFLAPFNPRGDGYQTVSGSSTGSCVAVAAYSWIDFTLGSDTNGSCRKPAHWMGCFAIRPTAGIIDTEGVASFCPEYDVPAFFGRDISLFKSFARSWYGDSPKLAESEPLRKGRVKIIYPTDYLPTTNQGQMKHIESFVGDLEGYLGVTRDEVSLADLWKATASDEARNIVLSEYLETAATMPYYKDACTHVNKFVQSYRDRYGKAPFLHRALRWRQEQADSMTWEERDEGWKRISLYKDWLLKNVLKKGNVVILPVENGEPNNRENPPPPFGLLSGYHPLYMSPIAGTPEVTAPVGEVFYHSDVTQRQEPLPISVSIVAAPGQDLDLIELVDQVFKFGKRSRRLATGRSLFV